MRRHLILLLFVIPAAGFSQPDKKIGFGAQLSAVCETNSNNGLQLAFLIHSKRHECAIGLRAGLQQMLRFNPGSEVKYRTNGTDVSYRYWFPAEIHRMRFCVTAMCNYFREYLRRDSYYVYYPNELSPTYGPVFDYSFNLREESKVECLGWNIGPGAEVHLREGFGLYVSGGPGMVWEKRMYAFTDMDSGVLKGRHRNTWRNYQEVIWSGNVGLIYRF
jgi:hypothetical protein